MIQETHSPFFVDKVPNKTMGSTATFFCCAPFLGYIIRSICGVISLLDEMPTNHHCLSNAKPVQIHTFLIIYMLVAYADQAHQPAALC